jgi:hypothetical protein
VTRPRDEADLIAEDFYLEQRALDSAAPFMTCGAATVNAARGPRPDGAGRPPSPPRQEDAPAPGSSRPGA